MATRTEEKTQLRQTLLTARAAIESSGHPDYEALLETRYLPWLESGNVVADIGAHRGRHLRRFIERVGPTGRVLGFEPLPFAFQHLQAFVAPNVEIHNVALSDKPGTAEFVFNEGAPEESGLQERIYNDPSLTRLTRIPCVIATLDQYALALDRLDFIKIDVEGGEIGCLNGGLRTLQKHRPLISVEYGYPSYSVYKHSKRTLFDLASGQGYVLYDLYLNPLRDLEDWELACDSVYWDFFMVPQELQQRFVDRLRPTIGA